ncbi:MAG: TRAP transporter substrate-binding protein DctP [Clostridiales Family XIII bacterium]|jgi:TRAP-type C4-dicarboxylate transport system substrate-binding protein|nr:TRAP transporter substrate-binding protein DctP [Clostridiales Family XIII bacterium]
MKALKKLVSVLFTVLVLCIVVACGNNTSTPAESAEDSPAGDVAESDEVYDIVISYYSSESIPPGQAILNAIEYAETESNGRLKFQAYFSGTYVSKADTMSALKTGTIDMAPVEATQVASVAVLNQIFNALIQSDVPDRAKVQEIYVKMIEENPELNEEMIKACNSFWLYPFVLGGYNLHGNETVAAIDDIKGLKIEAHGQLGAYINRLGGTAVELDSGDYYNGLKLGTVDSQLAHWAIVNNSQLNEVVKAHTVFGAEDIGSGLNVPCMGYLVNKDTWDGLPEDLRQIVKDAFMQAAQFIIDSDSEIYNKAIAVAKENNHEFVYIKGEDRKPWADAMQPILDEWFARCEDAGYDGKALYEKMLQYFEEAA